MLFLLPIRTDRPRIRPAYFTILLIAVNAVVHFASVSTPEIEVTLTRQGQKIITDAPRLVWEHGLWGSHPTLLAFLTHQFLHGGWMHLIGNMLFLWIFGSLLEDVIRPWGLAALYVLGGVLAGMAHIGVSLALGLDVDVPMVGASGAVSAIMGLFMLRFFKTRVQIAYFVWFVYRPYWGTFWVASIWLLLCWLVMDVLSGILDAWLLGGGGGTAHWAHVGGFAAGAAFAPFLGGVAEAKKEYVTDDPELNVEYLKRGEQVAVAERALRADPGNAYAMRRLAQAQSHAGDYELATATYLECVNRFAARNMVPQAADVYLELAGHNDTAVLPPATLLKIAQHLEADRIQQAAYAYWMLASQHEAAREGEYGLLRLAVIYHQSLQRPQDAVRCLQQFLARYPGSQWAPYAHQLLRSLGAPSW